MVDVVGLVERLRITFQGPFIGLRRTQCPPCGSGSSNLDVSISLVFADFSLNPKACWKYYLTFRVIVVLMR